MRTLIRGGTVVNPTGPQPADVLIDGETIAAVLSPGIAGELTADEVVVRDLDMEKLTEVRDLWQFYRDRRPDSYDSLVKP